MAAPHDQQHRGVKKWREPTCRYDHRTVVVENQLYLWGGDQDGMPRVHDSAEKRQFFSSLEVFDLNTGCWKKRKTSGTPPLGVAGYSCVAVRNKLHYFGGGCGHIGCYHNGVHTLSTSTLQWEMLAPSTTPDPEDKSTPMPMYRCGMVHFTDGEEDCLFVVGGAPTMLANEQHIFSLTTNQWSSCTVTGQTPHVCEDFTLTIVGEKRAALFGGMMETRVSLSDDLFIIDMNKYSMKWSKVKKPYSLRSVQWPERRYAHATSQLAGSVFVMIGGVDNQSSQLCDIWLCDSTTKIWKKLPIDDIGIHRHYHSVSVFYLGTNCVWVIFFGGSYLNEYTSGTTIIELIQDTDCEWHAEGIVQIGEYQKRLREGRLKGILGTCASNTMIEELNQMVLTQERKSHQMLQESEETLKSFQKGILEAERKNEYLTSQLQVLVKEHKEKLIISDREKHQLQLKLRDGEQAFYASQRKISEMEELIKKQQDEHKIKDQEKKIKNLEEEVHMLDYLLHARDEEHDEKIKILEQERQLLQQQLQECEQALQSSQLRVREMEEKLHVLDGQLQLEKQKQIQQKEIICAYEKTGQELQRKLTISQHDLQEKDQECSKLKNLSSKLQKEMAAVKDLQIKMFPVPVPPIPLTTSLIARGDARMSLDHIPAALAETSAVMPKTPVVVPQTPVVVPQTPAVMLQTPAAVPQTPAAVLQTPAGLIQTPAPSTSRSGIYSQAPAISKLMNLVAKKIPTKWYELGILLEIDIATLRSFAVQASDPVELWSMVFDQWRKEQRVPFTWETIISTLEEADENSTATEIKEWLKKQTT